VLKSNREFRKSISSSYQKFKKRFQYDSAKSTAQSATSGVEGLPPITVGLKDEILNALTRCESGCNSAEFLATATPIQGLFVNLQKKLPNDDPRRHLLAEYLRAI
jgi:hypothetical protein